MWLLLTTCEQGADFLDFNFGVTENKYINKFLSRSSDFRGFPHHRHLGIDDSQDQIERTIGPKPPVAS